MSININDFRFRIIFESREHYRLMDENKKTYPAQISGSLRKNAKDWPAVGDWVSGQLQPGDWILIEGMQPRKGVLSRKNQKETRPQILATNVDFLFIVTSANHDLNLNRLERYAAMAQTGGVTAVIVINKIELADDAPKLLEEVAGRFPQIEVLGVSVHSNLNLEQFERFALAGATLAFVGSSGVGKSSLTNHLLGEFRANVRNIRENDARGRHTTTHRELHTTVSGAFVIDTPGLRSLSLTDSTDLNLVFADIHEIELKCRFTDCRHGTEPGCAIQKSLANGELVESRWRNHVKLQKEQDFENRKSSKALMSEKKKEWDKRGKKVRLDFE